MMYLICFGLSIGLAYFAMKSTDRRIKILLLIASAALPIALAGLRDYSIGIDVENYYVKYSRYWRDAVSADSLWAYLSKFMTHGRGESLFALLLGATAQITGSFRVFLFVAHTVIVSGVYVGAFRMKKHAHPLLTLTLFYLLFFSHSLNILRQYMAMALIFAFLKDIEEHKFWRYILAVVVASMIHSTAWLALGALAVYAVMYADAPADGKFIRFNLDGPTKPSLKTRQILIVSLLGGLVLLFKPLCRLLMKIGVLNEKFLFYMENEPLSYAGIVTVLLVMELAAFYYFRKQIKQNNTLSEFFAVCSVCYLILQQLTLVIPFGKRIAGYYSLQNLITIGILVRSFNQYGKRVRLLVTGGTVAVGLGYWWYFYVLRNASQTMPYLFG